MTYTERQHYVTDRINPMAVRERATKVLADRGIGSVIHFHSSADSCGGHDHEEIA